jgi:hypothetical protein
VHVSRHAARSDKAHLQPSARLKIRDEAAARLRGAAGQDQLLSNVLQVRIQRRSGDGALHVLQPCRVIRLLLLHPLLPLALLAHDFRFRHGLEVGGVRGGREMRSAQAHVKHAAHAVRLADAARDLAACGEEHGFALARHL